MYIYWAEIKLDNVVSETKIAERRNGRIKRRVSELFVWRLVPPEFLISNDHWLAWGKKKI